jgi:hypothetical protein
MNISGNFRVRPCERVELVVNAFTAGVIIAFKRDKAVGDVKRSSGARFTTINTQSRCKAVRVVFCRKIVEITLVFDSCSPNEYRYQ